MTVVVVNYRTAGLTERAIRSALDDGAGEVIVVDNDSRDGSVDRLRGIADGGKVLLLESATNGGFGAGANLGASAATLDVLVFLNSDARVRPGALEQLASSVAADDGRALVGPRLLEDNGSVQRSAGMLPKPSDLLLRGLGMQRLAHVLAAIPGIGHLVGRSAMGIEYNASLTASTPTVTSMISGACAAIGREAFRDIGGFDERYFMYFEDADLCRRLAERRWPIRYLPAAEVEHTGGASSTRTYQLGPLHGPAMVLYLRRWYGRPGGLLALWILTVRGLVATVSGDADGRRALVGGVRAYRDARIASPTPRNMPSP